MRQGPALAVAVLVALGAAGAGAAIAIRSGNYARNRTATGYVMVTYGIGSAGYTPAAYCGSYGNVATQQGYAYVADDLRGMRLTLADSLERNPGLQDPARVTLRLDHPMGPYTWGPGRGGTVVLGPELLTADIDVQLIGPKGDAHPFRAHFVCQPRVPKKPGRP